MIDYLLAFADEATAQADPVVGKYFAVDPDAEQPPAPKKGRARAAAVGAWNTSITHPEIFMWRPADDTVEVIPGPDGDIENIIHHPVDSQWRIMISLTEQDPDLDEHPGTEVVGDRDTFTMIYNTIKVDVLKMQPIFAGMEGYPFMQP